MSHSEKLSRYKELRILGRNLNSKLTKELSRRNIQEGGRRLGILKGDKLILDTEDEIAVLMDYCLHDLRHDGQNAIDRFLSSERNTINPAETAYLHSLANAFFSLFRIENLEPGVGVGVYDMLAKKCHFIFDIGFSETACKNKFLAARIFTDDGITMTTGTGLPVADIENDELSQIIERAFRSAKVDESGVFRLPFKATAEIIRYVLACGAAQRVAYMDISPEIDVAIF